MKPGDVIVNDDFPKDRYRVVEVRSGAVRLVGATTAEGTVDGHDYGWFKAARLERDGWRVAGVYVDPAWRRTVEAAGFKVVEA